MTASPFFFSTSSSIDCRRSPLDSMKDMYLVKSSADFERPFLSIFIFGLGEASATGAGREEDLVSAGLAAGEAAGGLVLSPQAANRSRPIPRASRFICEMVSNRGSRSKVWRTFGRFHTLDVVPEHDRKRTR